ncbi:WYL domain-containing protein [Curtobacterium sp. MMLR14_002]|uniref:WYL domain-containing protein n=1 Tax=unclassified Curtobacterium TaxID=257496 RepID=UPI0026CB381E
MTTTAGDARRIAPYLPEDAVVEQLEDDRARVTLGSWSWDGLAGVVAGLAVPIRVEGPEALRGAVRDLSTRLATAAD